jgi:small-conductance mechanosensitive channel
MKLSTQSKILAATGLAFAIIVAAALTAPRTLRSLIHVARGDVYRVLTQPYFHLGRLPITPEFLIKVFVFLVALTFLSRFCQTFLQKEILTRTPWDRGQQYAVARVTGYLVFLFGLIVGLQSLGVDLSSLVVLGGALGVGAGFGLQPIVSNFVSGLVLLVERPIRLGDRVEVAKTFGEVVRIGGRSTWVRTNDNEVIIIPNSEFITSRVTNWTANDPQVRFSIPIGVSYDSNPAQVRELLLQVARLHPDVLPDPAPDVVFVGFGESSLDFQLRVFTIKQVQTPGTLKSDLLFAIFRVFGEHGIEIPFPQRDLHLRSLSEPIRLAGEDTAGGAKTPGPARN